MVRTLERVVEQTVERRRTQVTKKTTKISKISQQVENTQYQHDRIQRIIEQIVNALVQPIVNTVEVKHPTNAQENEPTSSE